MRPLELLSNNRELIFSLFTAIFLIIYAYTLNTFIKKARERKAEKKEKFFNAISEGLRSESIDNIHDMINLFKGVMDISSEDLSYRAGLSRLLREYLVKLVSRSNLPPLDDPTMVQWKNKISSFIRSNDEASPYADLPAVERNLINDITSYLNSNDKVAVERKLGELASSIQTREDDMTKIRNINKWSLPLAIVGVVLTIVFGIISIVK